MPSETAERDSTGHQLERLRFAIGELQGVVARADQKALFVGAICGMFANIGALRDSTRTGDAAALVLLFLAVAFCIVAVWPRTEAWPGEMSWPSVAEQGAAKAAKLKSASDRETLDAYVLQVRSLARLCASKVLFVRLALAALATSTSIRLLQLLV